MAELSLLPGAAALLASVPSGDGHAVLVIPGFLGTDDSTWILRRYLRGIGHRAEPWKLGRNLGLGPGGELIEPLFERLAETYRAVGGRKVSLVGWSLGGVQARILARRRPDLVRNVVTLGSPFRGPRGALDGLRDAASEQPRRRPDGPPLPGVPCTAIFSRTDGVVAWPRAMERASDLSESIEVYGSHLGLGVNASVLYATADRLAQPEGEWRPFDRSGWRGLAYGTV
jgi:pimeloyl-ACP methyl ester carboxylesterase